MISHLLLSTLAAGSLPAAPAEATAVPAHDLDTLVSPLVQDDDVKGQWTGSANVGAIWATGNTELTNLSAEANATFAMDDYSHNLKAWWYYAEQENAAGVTELTQRRIGGSYEYDYYVSDRLYYNGVFGIESDERSNLDLRWYVGGGAGYVFFDEETRGFDGELGLVFFNEEYSNGDSNDYIAARAAYSYWNQVNEQVRIEQDMQAFPSLEDIEDFYGRLDTRVKIKVSENMFAQIQHVFDYDNTPAAGAQRDDNRVILGLGWTF